MCDIIVSKSDFRNYFYFKEIKKHMWQEISIIGYLSRDPEMRYMGNEAGTPVTNLNVPTTRTWKNKDGEKQTATTWFKVAVWGNQAEACNTYLQKGSKVFVKGTLEPDEHGNPKVWMTNDGDARASYDIRASNVLFLSSPNDGDGGSTQEPRQQDDSTKDIPF